MFTTKRNTQKGVTLLEILLVLAISASIIVMSVRYYSSATYSMQTNAAINEIQAITAAIDNYAGGGSYAGITSTIIQPLLPNDILTTPWGTKIDIGNIQPSSYTVTLPVVPRAVCMLVAARLQTNNHYQISTPCASSGPTDLKYTYMMNV